ncbi:MAG: M2 family metallopeptidase [Myxococcales bacterium]|nr:M2 family metallopeptidase [Myxococcales bacterium]
MGLAFALSCGPKRNAKPYDPVDTASIDKLKLAAEAEAFVASTDAELRRLWVLQAQAEWTKQTDITDAHEAAAAKIGTEVSTYLTRSILDARRFAATPGLSPAIARQLTLLRIAGMPAPEDATLAEELATISAKMDGTYGKSKACVTDKAGKETCRDLGQLEDVMSSSRKPAELLAAWQGWHDTTGRAIGAMYPRFVQLANIGAEGVGYKDLGEMWRSGYDMPPAEFAQEVDRLWMQVQPLYKEVHCYARRKLNDKYGDAVVGKTGPMPAHLLGNMWAQDWSNIYPELEPFRGAAAVDVTPAIKKLGWDHKKMVQTAEGFFVSLGMDPLPASFWERSMFVKPAGKEAVCHASAWDVGYNDDLRIKMCIKPNHEDLTTIHHELGHNYYFHYYYKLPMLFQNGANDGFHEAIGDAIALSMTPDYLAKIGLLGEAKKNDKAVLNQQMRVALDKISFIPFGLLVDKWRWDVFSGAVGPEEFNAHWWELRLKYQGIVPPVARAATDFDPGAKYHVPGNTPYMRYFLAVILQFQFHRALCEKAGFKGPLHECSIYGNKAAGDALKSMLALGASKPWQDALFELTGSREMDATAVIDYFAPLMGWLKEQNQGQTCGW